MENNNLSLDGFITENQEFFLDRGVETKEGLRLRLQQGLLNNNPNGFLRLEIGLRAYKTRWLGTIENAFLIPKKLSQIETSETEQTIETELLRLKTYLNPESEILRSIDFLTGKGMSHSEIIKKTGVSKARLYRLLSDNKKVSKRDCLREKNG